MQGTSSQYYADVFGNLFPTDMNGAPVITNQGDQIFPDGSIKSAAGLYLGAIPWWVYLAGGVALILVFKVVKP